MEITSAGEDGESWEDKYRSKRAPVSLCWERNGTPLWAVMQMSSMVSGDPGTFMTSICTLH